MANISNQIKPTKTSNKTFAVYPNLIDPKESEYTSMVDGKVKFWLLDFTEGNDKSFIVTYNMELNDIFTLIDASQLRHLPDPISGTKIYGDPQPDGPYKGLCKADKIYITRQSKAKDGSVRKNPWTIKIDNGYGTKVVNENGGQTCRNFKAAHSAYICLSDADFRGHMKKLELYIEARADMYKEKLAQREARYAEFKKSGYRSGSNVFVAERARVAAEKKEEEPSPSEIETSSESQITSYEEVKPKTYQPVQKFDDDVRFYEKKCTFVEDFTKVQDGYQAVVMFKGSKFIGTFYQTVPEAAKKAREKNLPIVLRIAYDRNKKVWLQVEA